MTTTRTATAPRELTVKETSATIRRALRAAHPDTKFSVRMSSGTGYGWIHVAWTDGPTVKQVASITDQFEHTRYDSMGEGYRPTGNVATLTTGEVVVPGSCGVNASRSFTSEAVAWAARRTGVDRGASLGEGDALVGCGYRFAVPSHFDGGSVLRAWLRGVDLSGRDLTA